MKNLIEVMFGMILAVTLLSCGGAQEALTVENSIDYKRLLIGAGEGLYLSEDGGVSFSEVELPVGARSHNVRDIRVYDDGRIGISTRDGLHVFDVDLESSESYGYGLGIQFNTSILFMNRLWVATGAGLYVYDDGSPLDPPVILDSGDGLGADGFRDLAVYNGSLVIGHANGLSITSDGSTFTNITAFNGTAQTNVLYLKIFDGSLLVSVLYSGIFEITDLATVATATTYSNLPSATSILDFDLWSPTGEILAIDTGYGVSAYDGTSSRPFDAGTTGYPEVTPGVHPFEWLTVAAEGKIFSRARSGVGGGFYVSSDDGATFSQLDSAVCGLTTCWVREILELED